MNNKSENGKFSNPLPSGRDYVDNFIEWRNFVRDLKAEWKSLWRTRIDDKIRAEGIASKDFLKLFIDKGTVILATKDCRPPNFHEILKHYMPEAFAEDFNVTPYIGGWRKFIKEFMRGHIKEEQIKNPSNKPKKTANLQKRKGGRGWLHYTLKDSSL
ncbi:MAG: hypothetical protein QXV82_07615 [Ignisphaera sp.]